MGNISIRLKLWGVLTFFLLFFISIWAFSYMTSLKINEYLDSSKIESMKQADKLRFSLRDVEQLVNDAAQLKDEEIVAEADKRAEDFKQALASLQTLDPEHIAEYRKTLEDFDLYYKSARAAAEIIIFKDTFGEEILVHAEQVRITLPRLRKDVNNILNRHYDTFTKFLDQSTAAVSRLVKENSLLLFILLAISVVLIPLIIKAITDPIARLVQATNELASGNLDVKAEVFAHDEIGDLAIAFNDMTQALKEKSRALEETTEELKTANVELQEADRLKTEFLSSMSHELRTPLNAIINFSEQILEDWSLLATDKEWSSEANDMLQRVQKSSRHLLAMINELLDLAKIESGHMELNLVKCNLGEVVAEAVASVSSISRKKGLELGHSAPDDLPEILLDERKVSQILINLISNAIKFTESGSIHVKVERSTTSPGALIKVIDSGIGIPSNMHSVIFNRFRQVDGADSRSFSGTGLGLNLVKELTELHGGWVKVESAENKGSVFIIYLPFDPTSSKENHMVTSG